jgi:hypothetical protein
MVTGNRIVVYVSACSGQYRVDEICIKPKVVEEVEGRNSSGSRQCSTRIMPLTLLLGLVRPKMEGTSVVKLTKRASSLFTCTSTFFHLIDYPRSTL